MLREPPPNRHSQQALACDQGGWHHRQHARQLHQGEPEREHLGARRCVAGRAHRVRPEFDPPSSFPALNLPLLGKGRSLYGVT